VKVGEDNPQVWEEESKLGDCTGVVAVDLDQLDHRLEVKESKELVEVEHVLASLRESIVLPSNNYSSPFLVPTI